MQHKIVIVSLHWSLFLCKSSKTAAAACCLLVCCCVSGILTLNLSWLLSSPTDLLTEWDGKADLEKHHMLMLLQFKFYAFNSRSECIVFVFCESLCIHFKSALTSAPWQMWWVVMCKTAAFSKCCFLSFLSISASLITLYPYCSRHIWEWF